MTLDSRIPTRSPRLRRAPLAIFLLLLGLAVVPGARADHHPPTVEPDAFCGFTGVQNVTLLPGDRLDLPKLYENLTGDSWTFYIFDFSGWSFLPAEYMSAVLGRPLTLAPGGRRLIRGFGYQLPLSTPVGTYPVVMQVMANHVFSGGSRTLYVARCEYNLTVVDSLQEGGSGSGKAAPAGQRPGLRGETHRPPG